MKRNILILCLIISFGSLYSQDNDVNFTVKQKTNQNKSKPVSTHKKNVNTKKEIINPYTQGNIINKVNDKDTINSITGFSNIDNHTQPKIESKKIEKKEYRLTNTINIPHINRMGGANTFNYDESNNRLIYSYLDNTVSAVVFDLNTEKFVNEIKIPKEMVSACAFSSNKNIVAFGCYSGNIYLYDLSQSHIIKNFKGHKEYIVALCLSNDDNRLLSYDKSGETKLWDLPTNKLIKKNIDCKPRTNLDLINKNNIIFDNQSKSFILYSNWGLYYIDSFSGIPTNELLFKYNYRYLGRFENHDYVKFNNQDYKTKIIDCTNGKSNLMYEIDEFRDCLVSNDGSKMIVQFWYSDKSKEWHNEVVIKAFNNGETIQELTDIKTHNTVTFLSINNDKICLLEDHNLKIYSYKKYNE